MSSWELPRRAVLAAGLSVASSAGAARRVGDEHARVVLVLRGGADGLSLVVPYQDPSYYRARPTTAVVAPSRSRVADLALDEQFALHPGLAALKPLFAEGELSIGVGIGAPEIDRSHASASSALHRTLRACLGELTVEDDGDAKTLVDRMRRLAVALRAQTHPAVRVIHCDGWDTHAAQGSGTSGRLTTLVYHLGRAIDAFRREVGNETASLVVTSEFGRSVRETPMGGTDDGHAGVCFLLGGVRGGQIFGRWPDLGASTLSGGRRVAPTMDLASLLEQARPARR